MYKLSWSLLLPISDKLLLDYDNISDSLNDCKLEFMAFSEMLNETEFAAGIVSRFCSNSELVSHFSKGTDSLLDCSLKSFSGDVVNKFFTI